MKVWGQTFDVLVSHYLDHLIGGKSLRVDGPHEGLDFHRRSAMPCTPTTLRGDSILKQAIALLDNPECDSECVAKTPRSLHCRY